MAKDAQSAQDNSAATIQGRADARTLVEKAEQLKKAGNFEEALKLLNTARGMDAKKKAEKYWRQLGLSNLASGKYEVALDCFDNDLEVNGKSFDTLFAKGITLHALGKHSDAVQNFHSAYEMIHADTLKYSTKKEMLKTYKRFEEIVRSPNKKPEASLDVFCYLLGISLYELGRYDEAAESLRQASKLKANVPFVLYALARCELLLKHEEDCLNLLERTCNLDSAPKMLLRVDPVFMQLRDNERFRTLLGYSTTDF